MERLCLAGTFLLAAAWLSLPARSVAAQGPGPTDTPAASPASRAPSPASEPSRADDKVTPDKPAGSTSDEKADKPKAKDSPAKPPPRPYRDPFYDNDFSYLDDPNYVSQDPFDRLKRIPLDTCAKLDLGGEYQWRSHNEDNLRLDGLTNDFLLQHSRLYADLRHDWLRAYGEAIDATSSFERLPPRGSEENRWDAVNLFGEVRLLETGEEDDGRLRLRVGRQELDYGNQRLIASAPWANTRVTFDGAKVFWKSKSWDADLFWTRPVPLSQHVNNDHNFDHPDQSQQLTGVYAVWHAVTDHTVDLYYLRLDETDPVVRSSDGVAGGFDANTLGTRWKGRRRAWLWEVEAAYQFGAFSRDRQSAGFATLGAGYEFATFPWKPTFWTYYDWASGDRDPFDGVNSTFNQLIPQTHLFLGLADIMGRQNIEDVSFLLTARPRKRLTLVAEWHIFRLEQARDALYNNAGVPIRDDPTGAAGVDVGQEVDVTVKMNLGRHADFVLTYCYFFAGDFLARTGVGFDADFFYAWFTYKF